MNKIILITGATSGFGKAIAEKFAAEGWNCIITGRRKEILQQLAKTLTETNAVKVLPLVFDVQEKEAVFAQIQLLPAEWKSIDVLVNNAGYISAGGSGTANVAGTGGLYVYFKKMFGDFVGYLYGWAAFSVINTTGIAAISFVCAC